MIYCVIIKKFVCRSRTKSIHEAARTKCCVSCVNGLSIEFVCFAMNRFPHLVRKDWIFRLWCRWRNRKLIIKLFFITSRQCSTPRMQLTKSHEYVMCVDSKRKSRRNDFWFSCRKKSSFLVARRLSMNLIFSSSLVWGLKVEEWEEATKNKSHINWWQCLSQLKDDKINLFSAAEKTGAPTSCNSDWRPHQFTDKRLCVTDTS